jgi:hypothetical protein
MTNIINEAVPASVARQLEWMLVDVTEECESLKRALLLIASDDAITLTAVRACALLALEPSICECPSCITDLNHKPDNAAIVSEEV